MNKLKQVLLLAYHKCMLEKLLEIVKSVKNKHISESEVKGLLRI